MGKRRDAESTRRSALSLGEESDNADIIGWAHELRAWYALTQGDLHAAIVAGRAGEASAPNRSVSVQLAAQQAKAWARMGDRRQMELALDRGRSLLEVLPLPEDTDHHFVVDPAKFDFYAMDCYRIAGENRLAEVYAAEVIRTATDFNGDESKPMRAAEARITLGVIAARSGDIERAVAMGRDALNADRKSLPSLLMCSRELSSALHSRYSSDPEVRSYLDQLKTLSGL